MYESIFFELKLSNVNIICGAFYRCPSKSNLAIDASIFLLEETLINRVKKRKRAFI